MVDLLTRQPYLAGVIADPRWGMGDGWEAPRLPKEYQRVIHLGYRRWPELPLPMEVYDRCRSEEPGLPLPPLDLVRPWITVPKRYAGHAIVSGWTDCHFELKVGLLHLLTDTRAPLSGYDITLLPAPGSRWVTEYQGHDHDGAPPRAVPWPEAAYAIACAKVLLTDCSALHVLAVALGTPCVLVEPMEARLNTIFWPLGKDGRVRLVRGNDGEATVDARHTADVLREVLGD